MNMNPEASEQVDKPQPLTLIEQPDIRPVRDRPPIYVLKEDFPLLWRGRHIVVPAGFTSDGCTIPRFLWTITGYTPDGLVRAAALVHDWLYACGGNVLPLALYLEHGITMTRKECDQLFLEVCIDAGVPVRGATAWYRAVRIFGGAHWGVGTTGVHSHDRLLASPMVSGCPRILRINAER